MVEEKVKTISLCFIGSPSSGNLADIVDTLQDLVGQVVIAACEQDALDREYNTPMPVETVDCRDYAPYYQQLRNICIGYAKYAWVLILLPGERLAADFRDSLRSFVYQNSSDACYFKERIYFPKGTALRQLQPPTDGVFPDSAGYIEFLTCRLFKKTKYLDLHNPYICTCDYLVMRLGIEIKESPMTVFSYPQFTYDQKIFGWLDCIPMERLHENVQVSFDIGYVLNDVNQGFLLISKKAYKEAIPVFQRVMTHAPYCPQIMFYLGFAYERTGDIPNAKKMYAWITKADPMHYRAYVHLAEIYNSQGEEAVVSMIRSYLFCLLDDFVRKYVEQGRIEHAIWCLEEMVKMRELTMDLLFLLVFCYSKKDKKKALKWLDIAQNQWKGDEQSLRHIVSLREKFQACGSLDGVS